MFRLSMPKALPAALKRIAPVFAIAGVILSFTQYCQTHDTATLPPNNHSKLVAVPITHVDGSAVSPDMTMTIPYQSTIRGECADDSHGQVFVFQRSVAATWHLLASPRCFSNGWQLEVTIHESQGAMIAVAASHKPSPSALAEFLRQGGSVLNLKVVDCSVAIDHINEDGASALVDGHAKLPPHYIVLVERKGSSEQPARFPAEKAVLKGNGVWSATVPLRAKHDRGGSIILRAVALPDQSEREVPRPISSDEFRLQASGPEAHVATVGRIAVIDDQCTDTLPSGNRLRVVVEARSVLEGERIWLSLSQRRRRGNAVEQLGRPSWNQVIPAEFGGLLDFEIDVDARADFFGFAVAVSDDAPSAGSLPVVVCRRTNYTDVVARR